MLLGLSQMFCSKEPDSFPMKQFTSDLKESLLQYANMEWLEILHKPVYNSESGGKLRHYKNFKMDPAPARYVLAPLGTGYRWVLASLRAGCLPLAVETGRFRSPKIPLANRTCSLCNYNEVEDEYHFLITCNFLHKERFMLFYNIAKVNIEFLQYSSYDKFMYLMSANTNVCIIAKGIYSMYKSRTSSLYN